MRRRGFLGAGGIALAGLLPPGRAPAGKAVEIRMLHDRETGRVAFDPVGLRIEPGTRVRWVNAGGVHTATAYHPDNGGRARRIPQRAEPWDSGYLTEPGETFEQRLQVPGIHDYLCRPHEAAGMVGRLLVAAPGEGERAVARYHEDPYGAALPPAALAALPDPAAILRAGRIDAR